MFIAVYLYNLYGPLINYAVYSGKFAVIVLVNYGTCFLLQRSYYYYLPNLITIHPVHPNNNNIALNRRTESVEY